MKAYIRRTVFAYGMMLPGLIILFVFTIYPIIYGILISFTNYSVVGDIEWIGLQNFKRAFSDPDFRIALKNSIIYVIVVPIIQFLSILLAVLVNRPIRGVSFFRAAYFVPVVVSMVAVAITWKWMYQEKGIINYFLQSLGIIREPIHFLSSPSLALFSVMAVTVWKGLGYYMMIYLAGLQSIPNELMEAAKIDGANRIQTIWHVTIPLLKPFVLLSSLLSLISAIRVFDEVYVMTRGGPAHSSMVTSVYIYLKAFEEYEFGYASAIGIIVSAIIFLFTVLLYRYGKEGGLNYYD